MIVLLLALSGAAGATEPPPEAASPAAPSLAAPSQTLSAWSLPAAATLSRPVLHGPEDPTDLPDEGYSYKKKKSKDRKILGKVGAGMMATSAITALAAYSQNTAMEQASTMVELDAAFGKQKGLAYATYGLLGAGAVCVGLEVVF